MHRFWFLFTLCSLFSGSILAETPYDEVFTPEGTFRPAYQSPVHRAQRLLSNFPSGLQARLQNGPFNDRIDVAPQPLYLTPSENETLLQGGIQRARALHAFLLDILSENSRILSAPHFSPAIWDAIELALSDSEWNFEALKTFLKVHPLESIHFMHGADVIRGPDGRFFVLEDNVGNIGGFGDLYALRNVYALPYGESPSSFASLEALNTQDERSFFENFLKDNDIAPEDVVHIFNDFPPLNLNRIRAKYDLEGLRSDTLFDFVFPDATRVPYGKRQAMLRDGLGRRAIANPLKSFLAQREAQKKRSLIVFYAPFTNSDSWPEDQEVLTLYQNAPHAQLWHTPGLDTLLSSKAFLPFMDIFIRFYLNETPLLQTAPTFGPYRTPEAVLEALEHFKGAPVLKEVHSTHGEGVFLLERMDESQRRAWKNQMLRTYREQPESFGYVLQQELTPSVLDGNYIDLRPIVRVGGRGPPKAFSTPWARAVSPSHNFGKSNVSAGARELLVVIPPSPCESIFD